MACGGESGMDACRAEEHAPVGTPLPPKPAHRSSARGSNTLSREKNQKECLSRGSAVGCATTSPRTGRHTPTQQRCRHTTRAEERGVGTEGVRTCAYRGATDQEK